MEHKHSGYIRLSDGGHFDFEHPERSDYTVEEIASALARICRYTGHLRDDVENYSVAQHSVLVSYLVPPAFAFAGLMHDAAEAVMNDLSSPLKHLLPDYKALERVVETHVFSRYGLPIEVPREVKVADLIALRTEQRDLMPTAGRSLPIERDYNPLVNPSEVVIVPWTRQEAKARFLTRFHQLTEGALYVTD